MTDYIYGARGNAVGFIRGRYIHDIRTGRAIGQLKGTHVHKLGGSYVGELQDQMVVRGGANYGNIGNPGNPGNPGTPGNPGNRGSRSANDVFETLLA